MLRNFRNIVLNNFGVKHIETFLKSLILICDVKFHIKARSYRVYGGLLPILLTFGKQYALEFLELLINAIFTSIKPEKHSWSILITSISKYVSLDSLLMSADHQADTSLTLDNWIKHGRQNIAYISTVQPLWDDEIHFVCCKTFDLALQCPVY